MNQKIKTFFKNPIVDFFVDLVIIFILVFVVRTYFAVPLQISWQSMYESYYNKELIIIDKFSYTDFPVLWKFWWPERGDAVVIRPRVYENSWESFAIFSSPETKKFFLKRIIWVWWDEIKISWGYIYLKKKWESDFSKLDEKYLSKYNYWATYVWLNKETETIYEVPDWHYFLLWDNRNASSDSRTCFLSCSSQNWKYYIPEKDVIWKVLIDLWYFNLKAFSWTHPELWISTFPKFLNSPRSYDYQ